MMKQPKRLTALDRLNPGAIDYAVGVLRGVLSKQDSIVSDELRANIECSITHMRGAARFIERLQRQRS